MADGACGRSLERLLDFEEAALPFDADTQQVGERLRRIILEMLARPDLPRQTNRDAAAQDVMAMTKGMVDAAGVSGDLDQEQLVRRVERAVFGYLNGSLKTSAPDHAEGRRSPHG